MPERGQSLYLLRRWGRSRREREYIIRNLLYTMKLDSRNQLVCDGGWRICGMACLRVVMCNFCAALVTAGAKSVF